jgi:hypothetical protein
MSRTSVVSGRPFSALPALWFDERFFSKYDVLLFLQEAWCPFQIYADMAPMAMSVSGLRKS